MIFKHCGYQFQHFYHSTSFITFFAAVWSTTRVPYTFIDGCQTQLKTQTKELRSLIYPYWPSVFHILKSSHIFWQVRFVFSSIERHIVSSLSLFKENQKRQLAAALDFSKVSKVKSGLDKFRSSFANPPLHLLWRSLDVTGKILQFPRMTAILSLLALFLLLACFPLTVGLWFSVNCLFLAFYFFWPV